MLNDRRHVWLLVGSLLSCIVIGCAPFKASSPKNWLSKKEEPQVPLRITAFWTDTILSQAGLPGVSGFGARVFFYGKDEETPVLVDGSLTVYGYDDTVGDDESLPARKFVFPAEYLKRHYSKSDLGHSYSVWIPWQEANGPTRQISLILRFQSRTGGAIIMSDMSRHTLPGLKPSEKTGPDSTTPGEPLARIQSTVRQASLETLVQELPEPKEAMTTTTITVPQRLGRGGVDTAEIAAQIAAGVPVSVAAGATNVATAAAQPAMNQQQIASAAPVQGSQAAQAPAAPADRSPRSKSRAPIPPRVPPRRAPLWTRQSPGEWPSAPRSTPQAVQTNGAPANLPVDVGAPPQLLPVGPR